MIHVGRRCVVVAATALAVLTVLEPAAAQTIDFTGQSRTRFEVRDPAGASGSGVGFTSMRTRVGLEAILSHPARFFVQLQDVRVWGEETSTLSDDSADGLDLHQGWFELGADRTNSVRVGRQEIGLGGERLIGRVGWAQQGRAFDGVRATLRPGDSRVDLLAIQLVEESAPGVPGSSADASLLGAYGSLVLGERSTVEPYLLFETDDRDAATRQVTGGARAVGTASGFEYRVEGSIQLGDRAGMDVSAWMIGLRVGRQLSSRGRVAIWVDHLSGDEDGSDSEVGAFSTLYATNHKFYGFADLFTDIPAHTGGLGLQDFVLKGGFAPRAGVDLSADLHLFRFAADGPGGIRDLGREVDLTARYEMASGVTLSGGLSQVFVDDGLRVLNRLEEDRTFLYLMLDAVF